MRAAATLPWLLAVVLACAGCVAREAVEVVAEHPGHRLGVRVVRLHQHPPGIFPPPRPASDLGEQMESALRRTEIRDGQRGVRHHHAHQRRITIRIVICISNNNGHCLKFGGKNYARGPSDPLITGC